MVFSSYLFLFYLLPLALFAYYIAPMRARNLVLTLFSYVFYGWANPLFLFLLLGSTLLDYTSGLLIANPRVFGRQRIVVDPNAARSRRAKIILAISVVTNLSLLAFFKYFNFGVESYNGLIEWLGLPELRLDTALRVTLPLGISFYIFQSLSYVIDVYRGQIRAIRNFVDFAAFVSMYPQLVAGPIIRYSEIAKQIRSRTHTLTKFARGVAFFSFGMAKKVLLANPCGKVADLAFDAGRSACVDAWYGVIAYAFQIYFDFTGYSDMAIGLGLMMGFVFPKNFDSPYKPQSITEFWHRWHISLSTWLRDYLYVPLGGNRKGPRAHVREPDARDAARRPLARRLVELRGVGRDPRRLLALERARGKAATLRRACPAPCGSAITFTLVLFTWVFFRATDLPAALRYLGDMAGARHAAGRRRAARRHRVPAVLRRHIPAGRRRRLGRAADVGLDAHADARRKRWQSPPSSPRGRRSLTTQTYNPFIYFIF